MVQKLVSVVMPIYNASKFLDEAVQSVLNQKPDQQDVCNLEKFIASRSLLDIFRVAAPLPARCICHRQRIAGKTANSASSA